MNEACLFCIKPTWKQFHLKNWRFKENKTKRTKNALPFNVHSFSLLPNLSTLHAWMCICTRHIHIEWFYRCANAWLTEVKLSHKEKQCTVFWFWYIPVSCFRFSHSHQKRRCNFLCQLFYMHNLCVCVYMHMNIYGMLLYLLEKWNCLSFIRIEFHIFQ